MLPRGAEEGAPPAAAEAGAGSGGRGEPGGGAEPGTDTDTDTDTEAEAEAGSGPVDGRYWPGGGDCRGGCCCWCCSCCWCCWLALGLAGPKAAPPSQAPTAPIPAPAPASIPAPAPAPAPLAAAGAKPRPRPRPEPELELELGLKQRPFLSGARQRWRKGWGSSAAIMACTAWVSRASARPSGVPGA